jgi:hypothetical protein
MRDFDHPLADRGDATHVRQQQSAANAIATP